MRSVAMWILALVLIGCGRPPAGSQARQAILEVLRQSEAAWNRGDVKGFMASYWPSDSLRFVSNGQVHTGWRPVLERYRKHYADRAAMGRLIFGSLDVRPLGRNAAVVFGRFTLEREKDRPTGLFTLIFRKTPDGWRIVHDHTSTDCP